MFLFFIALMPFSTGFYSEYAGSELLFKRQLKVPMTFYVLNICCVGIVNYLMWRYITNPKHKLTEPPIDPVIAGYAKARAIMVPTIFLSMLPVAYFIDVKYAVYMPMLIPIVMRISKRAINKKHKGVQKSIPAA